MWGICRDLTLRCGFTPASGYRPMIVKLLRVVAGGGAVGTQKPHTLLWPREGRVGLACPCEGRG